MFPPQDVCAFGHEVDAAENDIAGVGFRSLKREFEGIAAKIGEFYDLVTLVMVAENDHVLAQAGLGGGNSVVQRVIRNQQEIGRASCRERVSISWGAVSCS